MTLNAQIKIIVLSVLSCGKIFPCRADRLKSLAEIFTPGLSVKLKTRFYTLFNYQNYKKGYICSIPKNFLQNFPVR
jgi:hypothetical protein